MDYKTPKYPRIQISAETHAAVAKAAKKRKSSIFKFAEGVLAKEVGTDGNQKSGKQSEKP